jgi:predicted DNA-binding transcriptional regulator YafY
MEEIMGKENFQKIKLLKIWEILRQDSDKDHWLDTVDIIEKLAEKGISCDRKTLYNDINELNAHGYKVYQKRSRRNLYYTDHSAFSVPELRILIDAVQSANFITEKKTEHFVDKIAALAGSYKADTLKNGVYFDNQKYSNEAVYNNILKIDEAINADNKVSFKYFDYDENGDTVFRKDGNRYWVNPLALVLNDDCYYLVCYSDKYKNLANYRIDRIDDIAIEDERIVIADCALNFDIAEYRRKAFLMYTGEDVEIELEFDKSLIDVMMDKFGVEIKIESLANGKCKLKSNVNISPVFLGWCSTFGTKLFISKPDKVRMQFLSYIKDIVNFYENAK